jgi:hypothetical protein
MSGVSDVCRASRALVAALAAGLLVAGCSGGDGAARPAATPAAPPSPAVPPPSPAPSPSGPTPPATAPTGPLRLTAGMTRPGTRLRFGQKATVPIRQYNPRLRGYLEGVLGIVVQPIRSIPGAQVEGNFDEDSAAVLKRSRAYYVKIIITNESGNPMPLEAPQFDGLHGDGELSYNVLIGGELPGCDQVGPPAAFDRKGARWVTCDRWISSPSEPIRQVRYHEPPYGEAPKAFDDSRHNRQYNLGPITWR